jgi:hypothetical protein
MAKTTRQQAIREMGVYIVIILALVRFLVYPLHGAATAKKADLAEQRQSYSLKSRLLERREAEDRARPVLVDADAKGALFPGVYEKGVGYFDIQADMVDIIVKFTEAKGMVITNFEFPEPVFGKNVTEIPVVLRLQGKMLDFIEILKIIENNERLLKVKAVEINNRGKEYGYSLTITAFRVEK